MDVLLHVISLFFITTILIGNQGLFLKNNVVLVLDPWIFASLSVYKAKTIKAAKASIKVSNVSYNSCTLLWYAKKEKYLHERPVYFHKKVFSQA